MRVNSTTFTKLMNQNHQMIIPIYQRVYAWKKEQCERLWLDIQEAAINETRKNHYTGTIYYIDDEDIGTGIDTSKYLLIDGQQRTTTLSLFVIALCKFIDSSKDKITKSKLYTYYLMNKEETGRDRYKLILSTKDRDTYLALLNEEEPPANASSRILKNYNFFLQWIKSSGLSVDMIYKGLQKITVINSRLERGIDDPQLIFEGLNSTGLKLSEAEKIKNYVFMSLPSREQEELYNKYWHKMESLFSEDEETKLFDFFIRDYLTIKKGTIAKLDKLYEAFRTYSIENRDEYNPTEHLKDWVKEMYMYAKCYAAIYYATDENKDINRAMLNINRLNSEVAYPLLLQVYYDYHIQKALTANEVVSIFECVDSYLFRRSICELPTHSLSTTFASLVKEIDEYDYANSVICTLLTKPKKQRFPNDDEFVHALTHNQLYGTRKPLKTLFYRLENNGRKEYVPTEQYTIEHIMPQNVNLSEEWKKALGEGWKDTQLAYLHTLGNLTLTGYNSELSDRPFAEKQQLEGGFKNSPLRLNRSLATRLTWNEEEILKRANELANSALTIWQYPKVSEDKLEEYAPATVTATSSGAVYDIATHLSKMSERTRNLFAKLEEELFALDSTIHQVVRKRYVAFKFVTNILDVRPRRAKLDVVINVKVDDLEQVSTSLPVRDIRGMRRANGEIDLAFTDENQIPEILKLVKIAMERQNPPVTAS
ncbi:hypothetical protein CN918_30565 [Priestia megaterium]|nr:hypothetical protein CN918_30565 [Priestia megaterium]